MTEAAKFSPTAIQKLFLDELKQEDSQGLDVPTLFYSQGKIFSVKATYDQEKGTPTHRHILRIPVTRKRHIHFHISSAEYNETSETDKYVREKCDLGSSISKNGLLKELNDQQSQQEAININTALRNKAYQEHLANNDAIVEETFAIYEISGTTQEKRTVSRARYFLGGFSLSLDLSL